MALDRASVVRKADVFVREGKLDQAAAEYRALVDENPGDSGAANTLGDLYARLGDSVRAIEQYTRLGESEWLQGFSAKAAAFYKKALKVDPNCETALLRLGEIAASQSLRVDATRHWTRLLERRRVRGDVAGEAEVARWLADVDAARPVARQATSVGMTLRVDPLAVPAPVAAEPVTASFETPGSADSVPEAPLGAFDPSDTAASGEVAWEAALMAAPSHGLPSMAAALAEMPVDDLPLVIEQFGQPAVESASLVLSPDMQAVPEVSSPALLVSSEAAAPATVPSDAVRDDWEIVVELDHDLDMPEVTDAAGATSVAETAAPVRSEIVAQVVPSRSVTPVSAPPPARQETQVGPSDADDTGDVGALISELAVAAETPSLRFQAAVQLGRIFLQRGDLAGGIEWLERACGVTAPVRDHGLLARYDLADALERAGQHTRALDVLSDLEMDAGSYRDVSARITRLSRATGSAP